MKKKIVNYSLFLLLFLPLLSLAQEKKEDKKGQIHVRVEKEIDGKKQVYEKTIDASKMTAVEREAVIQKMQDSLSAGEKGGKHRIKISITEGNNNNMNDDEIEKDVFVRKSPRKRNYQYRENHNGYDRQRNEEEEENNSDWRLDRDFGDLGIQLKRFGDEFPERFKYFHRSFNYGENRSTTIGGLDVFLNNPQTEILNINFTAFEKGDVFIKVMDVKGNIVANNEIKDFSGEYIGQVNIGKAEKGTYFIMVTQKGDGVVKRVVIP